MSEQLRAAWEAGARAAVAWREGEPITPVLEALALSVAVELTGGLAETSPQLRDALRRTG
jgi:hypothetical protein